MLGYHLFVSTPTTPPSPYLPYLQVLGVVSFAIGIWLYLTNNEFATLSEGRDLLGSVFLIAVGFGVIIVGFLGIVAAVWESMVITTVVSCQESTLALVILWGTHTLYCNKVPFQCGPLSGSGTCFA